jgi:transcriptional regulator with XRE-family HTH domain
VDFTFEYSDSRITVPGNVDKEKAQFIADGIYGEVGGVSQISNATCLPNHNFSEVTVKEEKKYLYLDNIEITYKIVYCTRSSCSYMKLEQVKENQLKPSVYRQFIDGLFNVGGITAMDRGKGIKIDFINKRIFELIAKKDVSNSQMSKDLGRGRSYIQNIVSGRALPSVKELFAICCYFEIDISDFFDTGSKNKKLKNKEQKNPLLVNKILDKICKYDDKSLKTVLSILDMLENN